MTTQVERTIELLESGMTLTTKKLSRLIGCRSAAYVLKRAIEMMNRMGLSVKRFNRRVRGGTVVKFYKMECV